MNVEKYKHAGLTIRILHDQDCENPLDNDQGVHITYKRGSRYTLGNDQIEFEEFQAIGKRIASGELIGLPVYAYIHSGTYLRTGSFQGLLPQGHAEFDSGQSGWVYVNKATALSWQGGKVLTKAKRANTLKGLESVVSEFGKFLNGECYGYIIEDSDGNELHSCWGFIGFEYVKEEAESQADAEAKQIAKDKRDAWLSALREARERRYWLNRGVMTV